MSQIDIQDLFNKSRFPCGWRLLSLFLYTPVGFILVLIRLIVALQLWLLATLIPDCIVLQRFLSHGLSFAFGIIVKIDSKGEPRDKQSRIIIANNVSVLDHFALYRGLQTLTPSNWELPSVLSNALGLQEMNMSSKDVLVTNIKQFLSTSNSNVALQPEFGTTNNCVALLKFNSWPFSIESSVQPVTIKASRPEPISVHLTSVASTWWTDVFWFMFVPYTIFTLKCLKIRRNTNHDTLVREVEADIATDLGLQTCSHTISDKTEYEKRCVMEKTYNGGVRRRGSPNAVVQSIEIQRMAQQVNEVLPFVPHNVILRDLLKTRNVDITIANILDGIVTYTPESNPRSTSPTSSLNRSQICTAKDTKLLGSTTFQERKTKMIREARERYIKKHSLTNC
ncbi:lipid droplet-regulating VLDL assembly factor AUP1-like [Prorops nasuta]|uniref:lipid droplet-regulating VLDL assembly factor AUP1-like n=1 Tax=Prorops nasuta TaxID=863751 RepID=UPI0034CEE5E0